MIGGMTLYVDIRVFLPSSMYDCMVKICYSHNNKQEQFSLDMGHMCHVCVYDISLDL